ncbi:hypothetical protein ON010_g18616 [Phytophthora cinnamomi]|nr:hypothetical protein ON010_g18616 [Phytophthora cinnamomi]
MDALTDGHRRQPSTPPAGPPRGRPWRPSPRHRPRGAPSDAPDTLGGLLDLLANDLRHELEEQVLDVALGGLLRHDRRHLLADGADLGRLGVGSLLDLVRALLGEGDAEQTHQVAVRSLDVHEGLDQGLPLADQRAQLVAGEVHAVEASHNLVALDLLGAEADLAESLVLVLVQVSEADLEHTAAEALRRDLGAGSAVHQGLAAGALREDGGRLHIVPVLAGERVNAEMVGNGTQLGSRALE